MATSLLTNEQIFRRVIEDAFSTGDLSIIDELVAPDFVERQRGAPTGPEGLKQTIMNLRSGIPDLRLTVVDIAVQGDKVWGRMVARGTHQGTIMGRPPTGVPLQIEVIDVCRFADGRMVEHWGVPDIFSLMRQIGAVPSR